MNLCLFAASDTAVSDNDLETYFNSSHRLMKVRCSLADVEHSVKLNLFAVEFAAKHKYTV